MHFNDLIIRFRSLTLTAFVTLLAALFVSPKLFQINNSHIDLIFLPVMFWFTAAIIDLGYYNRLLLGSVRQAAKFDESEIFKSLGLFGMTECITNYVRPFTSALLVILYYIVPILIVFYMLNFRG